MMSGRRTPRRNWQAVGGGVQDSIGDESKYYEVPAMEEHWPDHMGSSGGGRAPRLSTLRKRQIITSISKEEGSRALLQTPTSVAHQQVTVWPHDQVLLGACTLCSGDFPVTAFLTGNLRPGLGPSVILLSITWSLCLICLVCHLDSSSDLTGALAVTHVLGAPPTAKGFLLDIRQLVSPCCAS